MDMQENNSRHSSLCLKTIIKINWIWSIDIAVKYKSIKCLEDKNGKNIDDLKCDNFLNTTLKSQPMKK